MSIWNFELFSVDWIIIFKMDFVKECFDSAKVMFIDADYIEVFYQQIDVLFPVFRGYRDVGIFDDVFPFSFFCPSF